jgi:5-methylthioadenosine/S-adenosylhomocysteine deaminase
MIHTLIRGARTLDGYADILIRGDTIAELAKPDSAFPPDCRVIDARGKLLHPGLVNAHTHGHGNLAKGMGDRWTLELLLTAAPWTTGNRSLEDKYLGTLIGAAEMLMKGCTACYDLTVEFPTPSVEGLEAVGRAYRDAGMRAVVAPMVADLSFFEAIPGLMQALPPPLQKEVERLRLAPCRTTLENIRKALHGWKFERDEIRPAVAPTIPLHCSDEFMVGCANLAREYGTGLHTHVSESKVQAIAGLEKYGKSLAAHMEALGLVGPDFTVAHGVWLDDEDMKRLGGRGASVAHNPGSNMRLGSGIADMRRMLECGINVGIGTDGANCSDNLNMYEAMRIASLASKVRGPDWQRWITTREVVEAATAGSARALGFGGKIGRIAPGCKADIVFLDLEHINWIPLNHPVNALVHTEDGSAVHSVMVGGRMVVENRKLLNVDLARLARDAERARERLERLNRDNKTLYERLEPVVSSFCPALARQPLHINRYAT